MSRSLVAITLVLAALLSTVTSAAEAPIDCTAATQVFGSRSRIYHPSEECIYGDEAILKCIVAFTDCKKEAIKASSCDDLGVCFNKKLRCLERTTPTTEACTSFAANMQNELMYMVSGAHYNQSRFLPSCLKEQCLDYDNATATSSNNTFICPRYESVCEHDELNFHPTTRAPNQTQFTLTFAGNWVNIIAEAPQGSAKYDLLIAGLQKGIARILSTLEHMIAITGIRSGSLVADFVLDDADISAADAQEKLVAFVALENTTIHNVQFAELADAAKMDIVATSIAIDDNSPTPAPPTEDDCGNGCISGSVVGALVLTGLIIFVIILCVTKRSKAQKEKEHQKTTTSDSNEPTSDEHSV